MQIGRWLLFVQITMRFISTASKTTAKRGRNCSLFVRYVTPSTYVSWAGSLRLRTSLLWPHNSNHSMTSQLWSQHDLHVSSVDWSPRTNKIVSCSHDRNAFVWSFETDSQTWKPTLVILRIDRAATDVKWSLDGRRFAVASSAKVVPVCMYEPGNDW